MHWVAGKDVTVSRGSEWLITPPGSPLTPDMVSAGYAALYTKSVARVAA
jgi:hypothetical protein